MRPAREKMGFKGELNENTAIIYSQFMLFQRERKRSVYIHLQSEISHSLAHGVENQLNKM